MNPGSFRFHIVMLIFLIFSTNLSCLYQRYTRSPLSRHMSRRAATILSRASFVSTLCSCITTLAVTEYGLCSSRTKSNSFIRFWLNVRRWVMLSACWRWHSEWFIGWLVVRKLRTFFIYHISWNKSSNYATALALRDLQDPSTLAGWFARPSCQPQQHRTSQGGPEQPTDQ